MSIPYRYLPIKPEHSPNDLQLKIWPHREHTDNVLILGRTSSGKSKALQMLGTDDLDEGGSIIYIAILKALAEEKVDEWAEAGHPWEKLPKTSITGDYTYDSAKIDEINAARLISITPESLVSCLRNRKADRAQFLDKVMTVFADEQHLVGQEGRGATYEAALIELLTDFPEIRIVGLSGTIPNREPFVEWMTKLNGRQTHVVESDYRPVELNHHHWQYAAGLPSRTEPARIQRIIELVTSEEKRQQQFLIGVFKKAFGRDLLKALRGAGVSADFHSADIKDRATRKALEASYKRGTPRVLICTQTLIAGVNLPARNVICTCPEAGGKDIQACDIQQLAGRAGRPGYDTEGDVYYLHPDTKFNHHMRRIIDGEPIISQMIDVGVLASHFLGAVYMGRISTIDQLKTWYCKTLAFVQQHLTEAEVGTLLYDVVYQMKSRGMIKKEDNSDAIILTSRGRISAQMLMDPYDLSDWIFNFHTYFALKNPSDIDIARAIGKIGRFYSKFTTREEKAAIPQDIERAKTIPPENQKHCAAVFLALQGRGHDMPPALSSAWWDIKQDLDRTQAALIRACRESEFWTEETFPMGVAKKVSADEKLRMLFMRVKRSITSWDRAKQAVGGLTRGEIIRLQGVGLEDLEDVKKNMSLARQILKPNRIKELGLEKVVA